MTKLLTPIEVIQALQDGKQVDWKYNDVKVWNSLNEDDITLSDVLNDKVVFRLAQEMITISDISFPKPETEKPKLTSQYYITDLTNDILYREYDWYDDEWDLHYLNVGMVHLTKDNAIAHAKALIKLSGGHYE